MAAAIYSKRLVGASALLIYAYTSYPLAEPTSVFSLSLADGQDAVEVDQRDAFAANVRAVAARMGVKNPERLSIRVSEDSTGAALGANATIDRRGACMVLPAELYDAFHASPALREKYPSIPTIDEINFVLAHESTHIAKNHALFSNAFLPLSLVLSNVAIRKIPNKVFAGLAGIAVILGGNTLLSWRLEHEADHAAAQQGFAHGGIDCFQRKLDRNCEVRAVLHSRLITKEGNYLGDTTHPLLTSRIRHLQHVAASNVLSASSSARENSVCRYCLRL
jgi:Zn-dependent protease with chaperone function